MTRTEEFLDLYKQLEQAATSAYGWEPDGRAIYRLERMAQFESRRTELSYCREVRNLLQHNCLIDGEYAVEPSEPMLALLRSLLLQITQPVLCMDVCTPIERVYARSLSDRVAPTMLTMFRRGLSHVPVLSQGKVAGVFSESTVFAYLVSHRTDTVPEDLRIGQLQEFLNAPTRRSEVYRYLSAQTTLVQAEAEFEAAFHQGKRISMFFLTKNGGKDERLLGILTPYDILGN
ncbi:MAG TPA: hypothetical protein IAB92_01610 [Candidatus Faecousia faecigallinarum]|nr:hypothetical protein [Candidatus Faecousia faecigallinarum]